MPKLRPWSEMTEADIYEIRRQKCVRCPYAYAGQNNENGERTPYDNFCAYIVVTGHRRKVRPELCEYWKDKNVKIPKGTFSPERWDESLVGIRKGRGDSYGSRGDC